MEPNVGKKSVRSNGPNNIAALREQCLDKVRQTERTSRRESSYSRAKAIAGVELPANIDAKQVRIEFKSEVSISMNAASNKGSLKRATTSYKADIYFSSYAGNKTLLGKVKARVIDTAGKPFTVHDVLEQADHYTRKYCSLFTNKGEYTDSVAEILGNKDLDNKNFLIIDDLEILQAARGRGVGPVVLRLLEKRLGQHCRLAALYPFPLQYASCQDEEGVRWLKLMGYGSLKCGYQTAVSKLRGTYNKAGYKLVGKTSLMIHDLSSAK